MEWKTQVVTVMTDVEDNDYANSANPGTEMLAQKVSILKH